MALDTRAVQIFILIAILLSSSCSVPSITDAQLVKAFGSNQKLFKELAALSQSRKLDCPYASHPEICMPTGAQNIFNQLKLQTNFKKMQMYVKKNAHNSLWLPVELTGWLSTSSSAYGYVYSATPLEPITDNVTQNLKDRQAYKAIGENWYLFVSN